MRTAKFLLPSIAAIASINFAVAQPNVAASIKPIHSLVSSVMEGVATPLLLVEAGSPHTYSLKPSQARYLQEADAVFWVAHDVETFLEKPLESIPKDTVVVELGETKGLVELSLREGGLFDSHGHDDHDDHDKHDDHAKHDDHDKHDKHDDHNKHDDHAKHDDHDKHDDHAKHDDHEKHDDHGHGEHDPHFWLDPMNAKVMVREIQSQLSSIDPVNAAKYESNAKKTEARLDELLTEIKGELAGLQGSEFIAFHDAYQYFENRFGVKAIGTVTVSPEVMPGAKRLNELREKVKSSKATCVFSEPQFEPRVVEVITDGTDARTGVLDPLGAELESGTDLYPNLIRRMAKAFKDCLSS